MQPEPFFLCPGWEEEQPGWDPKHRVQEQCPTCPGSLTAPLSVAVPLPTHPGVPHLLGPGGVSREKEDKKCVKWDSKGGNVCAGRDSLSIPSWPHPAADLRARISFSPHKGNKGFSSSLRTPSSSQSDTKLHFKALPKEWVSYWSPCPWVNAQQTLLQAQGAPGVLSHLP